MSAEIRSRRSSSARRCLNAADDDATQCFSAVAQFMEIISSRRRFDPGSPASGFAVICSSDQLAVDSFCAPAVPSFRRAVARSDAETPIE